MTQVTIPTTLGGSGNPYSDDGTSARDMQGTGFRSWFFALVQEIVAACLMAYNSAVTAVNAPGTNGTSTTSMNVATGSQTFTTQTGKSWSVGQPVVIAQTSSPANAMFGVITAYNSGTGSMTVSVNVTTGSGAGITAWTISLTGLVKRALRQVTTIATAAAITPNVDTTDVAHMTNTQAAGNFTINAPTGTPADGQVLIFRLKCTNAQTYGWNSAYRGSADYPLPTVSSAGKTDYIGFEYNAVDAKWDYVPMPAGY